MPQVSYIGAAASIPTPLPPTLSYLCCCTALNGTTAIIRTLCCIITVTSTVEWKEGLLSAKYRLFASQRLEHFSPILRDGNFPRLVEILWESYNILVCEWCPSVYVVSAKWVAVKLINSDVISCKVQSIVKPNCNAILRLVLFVIVAYCIFYFLQVYTIWLSVICLFVEIKRFYKNVSIAKANGNVNL